MPVPLFATNDVSYDSIGCARHVTLMLIGCCMCIINKLDNSYFVKCRIWACTVQFVFVTRSGFNRQAVNTLKLVIERYPNELHVWNDIGVKGLMAGLQEVGRKAFSEVGTF